MCEDLNKEREHLQLADERISTSYLLQILQQELLLGVLEIVEELSGNCMRVRVLLKQASQYVDSHLEIPLESENSSVTLGHSRELDGRGSLEPVSIVS